MVTDAPKRRWYQFSLLTLMIVVTLFCATVGWVGYRVQRARANRDRVAEELPEVAAIRKLGGIVDIAYLDLRPQTSLEKLFNDPGSGDDPVGFSYVWGVYLPNVDDTIIEQFKTLEWFYSLNLESSNVTDAHVAQLKGARLGHLDLEDTSITDAGLRHVSVLTELSVLDLGRTNITDAGLKHLKGLTNLQTLYVEGTNVTDEGVKKLQQALPNCEIRH